MQPGIPTRAFGPVLLTCLAAFAACHQDDRLDPPLSPDFQDAAVLAGQGPLPDQTFDFGTVVEPESRTLTHQYTLENTGSASLNLVRSVNGKPCCGEVESLKPRALAPHQSATFTVTLKVGGTIGPLDHLALVETDLPQRKTVRFSTVVTVHPKARILEADEGFQAPSPGRPGRKFFVASTYGTEGDPPLSLDEGALTATAPFSWDSPETQRLVEGRVLERSRPFSIELSGSGEPGYRSEVITLRHKSKTLVDYPFEWELPRLLSAEPSSLILSTESGKSERTIVLRSHDHAKFRVLKVQADIEGVSSDCQDQVASSTKVIRFAIDPGRLAPGMAGEIKIHTDHPAQADARVSILCPSGPVARRPDSSRPRQASREGNP